MSQGSLMKQAVRKWQEDGLLSTAIAARRLFWNRVTHPYNRYIRPQIIRWRLGDEVTIRGVTIVTNGVYMDSTIREYLYTGEYEADEASAIDSYLLPEMDVVDFGACLGFTACFTNKRLDSTSKHIAVEPNPQVQEALKATRKRNNCEFDIVQKAYARGDGSIEIYPADSPWSASQYRPDTTPVSVETVSLATLIEEYSLSNLAIIIDIEGAEAGLVEDELEILEAYCDLLIIEFHDDKDDIEESQRVRIRDARNQLDASAFKLAESGRDVAVYVHSDRYPHG